MESPPNPFIQFAKWCLKWIGILAGGLITLALVIWGATTSWNYVTVERHKNKIELTVKYDPTYTDDETGEVKRFCSDDYPFLVAMFNESGRTVEMVHIYIEGRLPNRSTNIMDYGARVKYDFIVPPKDSHAQCWSLEFSKKYEKHVEIKDATYSGKISSISFADKG